MERLVSLLLLAAPSAARAEPHAYVEAGLLFGAADPVIGWNIMPALDGGYRFAETLWFHAGVGYGPTIDNLGSHGPNHGSNSLARGGVELRWRASTLLVLTAGLDLGVAHGTWGPPGVPYSQMYGAVDSISSTAFVAIPRIGFEVGGTQLRARFGLESDLAIADRTTSQLAGVTRSESTTGTTGIEVAAGAAYLW
jgi:hypothetical protein